jgi:ATP-binding cassette subfamily B protein
MTATEFSPEYSYQFNHRSPLRWIFSHVLKYWWLIGSMVLGAVGNAIGAAMVPVILGIAVDTILADPSDLDALLRYALIIGGSQIVRGILQFGRNFSAELFGQRLERDIRDEFYLSLLGKSMSFHNLQPVGDTMARATNDVREINLMFNPGINVVIGSANFLIMPLILAPSYHPSLILTPILFTLAYFIATWRHLRSLRPVADDVRTAFGSLNTRLAEALDGIETVKGAAQERIEIGRFEGNAAEHRQAYVRQGELEARFIPLLLLGFASAGAFLHAIILYRQGLLQVGQVIAYVSLMELYGFPTFAALFGYSQVALGMAGARRLLELITRRTELDQNPSGHKTKMRGAIHFDRVSFSYKDGDPMLKEVDFQVEPGTTLALVGQTGSGKTTLTKLVNRTHDVSRGQVLVDGVDVRRWDMASLRSQISIIEQDIFLFSRSLADNIAFGRQGATPSEIEAAAKAAQAHDFILGFEEGYDTIVGERGVTLSGGQRQRIALARAFLTDPSILILDDSTSAIDSATEDEIQQAIFTAAQGRTTIIITHRLSQIRWADTIVVLRNGSIAAKGSHEELMGTSDTYRRIFNRYEGGI